MLEIEVDPDKKFQAAIVAAGKEVEDLRIPLTLIAQSWFKTNRSIFSLSGKGKYVDLSEQYKKRKNQKWGFIYPILRASGRLEDSITNPTDGDSVNKIINQRTLIVGTKTPYAGYHQKGMGVPKRPMVLIGSEQVAPAGLNRRLDAWVKILADFVIQKTNQKVGNGSR